MRIRTRSMDRVRPQNFRGRAPPTENVRPTFRVTAERDGSLCASTYLVGVSSPYSFFFLASYLGVGLDFSPTVDPRTKRGERGASASH